MNCSEARQYTFAFLDNELDSALSIEVQQHIEHCPLCARECQIESVVRRHLATTLGNPDGAPAFDESALVRLLRPDRAVEARNVRRETRPWRLYGTVATAATLLFTLTLFVAVASRTTRGETLADALVDDFDEFVTKHKPLQVVSSDAEAVSHWLRDQTALAVNVPDVDPALATLMGGRKCKVDGAPAAFAVYRIGDELASVVALRESEEALARMERVDRDGHTHWIDHCRGHTVLACRRGDLIYAVVSRLAEEMLTPLMPPAEG